MGANLAAHLRLYLCGQSQNANQPPPALAHFILLPFFEGAGLKSRKSHPKVASGSAAAPKNYSCQSFTPGLSL